MSTPASETLVHVEEAVAALGRLRTAWPWLAQARHPGVPGTHALVERRLSPAQEAAEAQQTIRDRRARMIALSGGSGRPGVGRNPALRGASYAPAGPHADAARVGPIKVRVKVASEVRGLSARIIASSGGAAIALPDPKLLDRSAPCAWCAGTGRAQKPADWAWEWPEAAITCPLCGGWGASCVVCRQVGPCQCDLSDEVMAVGLRVIGIGLREDPGLELAMAAAHTLVRADESVRGCLGLGPDDHRVIKAPCPACGRRELYAEVSSPSRDEWSVVCRSVLCRCAGPGCGCGLRSRWPGRRHRWLAQQMWDLADRLGVSVPTPGR